MSFKAVLDIDGDQYRVLNCDYEFKQEVDATGRPSSTVRGGIIRVEIESTDDTSNFEWMCDSYMRKDGKIIFNKRDEDSKLKELEFKEAYLIGYREAFDNVGNGSMNETLTFSARIIKLGDGEHENEWAL